MANSIAAMALHTVSAAAAVALGLLSVWLGDPARDDWDRLGSALLLGPAWGIFGTAWLIALLASIAITRRLPGRRWLVTPVIVVVAFLATGLLAA